MVSLLEAASVASHQATGEYTSDQAALNKLARRIAQNTSVFARPGEGSEFRLVTRGEIEQGRFALGGARLEFEDGRPPLGNISILRREWQPLLQRIEEWTGEAEPAQPEQRGPTVRGSGLLRVRPGIVRRMALLSLLCASFLQFYYIGVVLEISSLPTIVVFVPPNPSPRT